MLITHEWRFRKRGFENTPEYYITALILPQISFPSALNLPNILQLPSKPIVPYTNLHLKPHLLAQFQLSTMQLQSIIAVLALSLTATASPLLVERNDTPAQAAQNQCGNTATAKCCNQVAKEVIGLVPIPLGLDCTALNGKSNSSCSDASL